MTTYAVACDEEAVLVRVQPGLSPLQLTKVLLCALITRLQVRLTTMKQGHATFHVNRNIAKQSTRAL